MSVAAMRRDIAATANAPTGAGTSLDLPTVTDIAIDQVDRTEMLRYLGYHGQSVDAELAGRIDDAVARVLTLARPRVALRDFDVDARVARNDGTPELRLAGTTLTLVGRSVAEHLSDADAVVVMAVTLGMGIERELQRLSLTGDTLGQVLFDAAATATVEQAADSAEALVVAAAAAGDMGTTWRFSPGYGDLPLSCQRTLLASVDASRRLGLTLTKSDLLVPTKSVTAVIGAGKDVDRGHRSGCDACNLHDHCALRAAGTTCRGARLP